MMECSHWRDVLLQNSSSYQKLKPLIQFRWRHLVKQIPPNEDRQTSETCRWCFGTGRTQTCAERRRKRVEISWLTWKVRNDLRGSPTWQLAIPITRALGTSSAVLVFLMKVTEGTWMEIWWGRKTSARHRGELGRSRGDERTLVSRPKTLEWKQIQLSETNIFPWYKMSLCNAHV